MGPGVDFSVVLEEDLGGQGVCATARSDGLQESKWVRHEIAYAHARRIEVLALTFPDCTNHVYAIDEAFRLRLAKGDVMNDEALSLDALASTLDAIELAHARALRRRREQILGSVRQKLRMEGCECEPEDNWCVLATRSGNRDSGLFWVTPRRPTTTDFRGLSQQHKRVAAGGVWNLKGAVVHDVGRLADDYQELMDWLAGLSGNELETIGTCSL